MPGKSTVQFLIKLKITVIFAISLISCQTADAQRQGFVSFERIILDDTMRGGYGVEIADVDGDGNLDIIALSSSRPAQLVWYKNPDWQVYKISSETNGNIDAAPLDIDGDGDVDLVLATDFNLSASTEGGSIYWYENPSNPMENESWARHYIDAIPTSHRIKWADVNGDGTKELINLPIIGIGAEQPLYDVNTQLTAYGIPKDPTGDWGSVKLDESLQVAHGLQIVDWDEDGREDILTASLEGVNLYQLAFGGEAVHRSHIGIGNQGEKPQSGSSEVAVGSFEEGEKFVATIEPWHGNEVVIYTPGRGGNYPWSREVIETEFVGGHALLVSDLDNDGVDEIIAGHRSAPYNLFIYRHEDRGNEWQRIPLDLGGIGLAGLAIADLNGDGFKDIVGIGSSTANVVLYMNSGL